MDISELELRIEQKEKELKKCQNLSSRYEKDLENFDDEQGNFKYFDNLRETKRENDIKIIELKGELDNLYGLKLELEDNEKVR
jgi:hypothetical protein